MRDLQECAQEISANFSPDDPMLVHYWDSIRSDLGWGVDQDSTEGRQRFLSELPSMRVFLNKGPKSAGSRWCSFQIASAYHDIYWAAEAFVMAFFAIKRGRSWGGPKGGLNPIV